MIQIDGNQLTIDQVIAVCRGGEEVALADRALERIEESRGWVEEILAADEPVYGINTGFGIFSDRRISREDAAKLSRNLILSHAVATGPELAKEVVRAAMLIRANTLAKGYSGIRPVVVETLIRDAQPGRHALIPSQGSLGSSGDLAQLSHMALVFTTDEEDLEENSGWAEYQGKRFSGKAPCRLPGIARIILGAKEGLAVNNGATFSAAIGALAVYDSDILLGTASITLAMSLEAMLGVRSAFDPQDPPGRNHRGQIVVAEQVRELTNASTLWGQTTGSRMLTRCAVLPRYRGCCGCSDLHQRTDPKGNQRRNRQPADLWSGYSDFRREFSWRTHRDGDGLPEHRPDRGGWDF